MTCPKFALGILGFWFDPKDWGKGFQALQQPQQKKHTGPLFLFAVFTRRIDLNSQ